MAHIEYGFLYRDKDGKRKASTTHHSCCFGSLGTALLTLDASKTRYIPMEGVKWIPGKVIVSSQETAADFRKWWKRLRKDFPTYKVNGVSHPAPTARYYDVDSRQPGHLNVNGVGPLKQSPKRSYVILSFPEHVTNDVLYIGLKFYMKNLMNPNKVNDKTMCGLWAEAESRLKAAGVDRPNMAMIMAAVSSSSGAHTMGYAWPVGGSQVFKNAFKAFLTEGYECLDFTDNGQKFHETGQFSIYNSKSDIHGLGAWGPNKADDVKMVQVFGWADAIERIKQALE